MPGSSVTVPAWRAKLAVQQGWDERRPLTISIHAPGVWRRRSRLGQLLGEGTQLVFGRTRGADAILGWGRKGVGQARSEAAGLPYIAVEDAFLSRLGADEKRFGLLGIVIDPVGVYYDAAQPAFVEELITASAERAPLPETQALLATMRRHGLGKFNTLDHQRLNTRAINSSAHDVVVVDQIAGDLSIPGGLASAELFTRMLEAAHDENPGRRIAVKLHPYDGVGGRTGHLREAAERVGCKVIPNTANWLRVAGQAERVYVVSSNAGLEALIAGTPVTCFGAPFFGGWGLTDDRQNVARRKASPSLDQLCSAVYGEYAAYWIPSVNRRGSALDLARFIAAQQRHAEVLGAGLSVYGVPKLKAPHIRPFVPRDAPLKVRSRPAVQEINGPSAVWASKHLKGALGQEKATAVFDLYAEDGFIRSSGLGADLVRPSSLVFDSRGIYFDPERSSDLEHMLETEDLADDQKARGAELITKLRGSGTSKYNVGDNTIDLEHISKRIVLVPGQVENDASILLGAGAVKTNRDLLIAARAARPEAYLIYKPHPDVAVAGRPGHVPDADQLADLVLGNVSADAAINAVDEVHTITSLMGFEALLRKKTVVTYGAPFYAGWGLTTDNLTFDRRRRRRTIEELAYLALIAYPFYVSPLNNEPCPPEDVIECLSHQSAARSSIPGGRSALRLWRKLKTWPAYLR